MKRSLASYVGLGLSAVAIGLGLAACGNFNQKSLPEPVTNHTLSRQVAYTLPDGFRNVAFGCNGTVGVYVTSRGAYKNGGSDTSALPSSVAVLAADPNCK